MPPVLYAVRLRASWDAIQTTIGQWALRCDKILCYEHDERHENIHCHLLLEGVSCSIDTLKGDMRQHGIDLKGAGQLSFKTKFKLRDGTVVNITDANKGRYVTYMSKGKYDPKYNKGYEPDWIALQKSHWIEYDNTPEHPFKQVYDDFETFVCKALTAPEYAMVEYQGLSKDRVVILAYNYTFALHNRMCHRGMRQHMTDCIDTYCLRHNLMTALNIRLK